VASAVIQGLPLATDHLPLASSLPWYHAEKVHTVSARKDKSTTTQARRRARRTQVVFSVIALLVILAFMLSLVSSP
jgi:hypothetical protein